MAEGEGSPVPVRPPVPRPPVPRHPSAEDGSQRRGFPGQREPRGVQGIRGGPTGAIQELLEELLLRGEAEGTPGDAPELVRRDTEGHTQGDTPWGRGDEGSAVNSDARVVDATPSQTEAGPATALKERQTEGSAKRGTAAGGGENGSHRSGLRPGRFRCWQCGSTHHPSWRCEAQAAGAPAASQGQEHGTQKQQEGDQAGSQELQREPPQGLDAALALDASSERRQGEGSSPDSAIMEHIAATGTSTAPPSQDGKSTERAATAPDEVEAAMCRECRDSAIWGKCSANAATKAQLQGLLTRLSNLTGARGKSRGRGRGSRARMGVGMGREQGKDSMKASAAGAQVLKEMRAVVVERLYRKGHRARLEVYNILLEGARILGQPGHGEEVLWEMQGQGVRPDSVAFNYVLNAWCESGSVERALHLTQKMLRLALDTRDPGLWPRASTFNTLLKGLALANRPGDAMDLLRTLLRLSSSSSPSSSSSFSSFPPLPSPSGSSPSSVFPFLSASSSSSPSSSSPSAPGPQGSGQGVPGRAQSAVAASRGLTPGATSGLEGGQGRRAGGGGVSFADTLPVPDARTFNTVLNAWCQEGEVEEGRSVLRMMRMAGVSPDTVSYNTLLVAYAKLGRTRDCQRVLREMANAYVKPTQRTFAILAAALCDAGELEEAHNCIRRMGAEYGVTPNAACFNTVLKGYATRQLAGQAEQLLQEMRALGIAPDIVSYSTVMNMWSDSGMPRQAEDVLQEMQSQGGISPDVEAFTVLAKAYLRARDGRGAERVLQRMRAQGLSPNTVTYTTVISTWCSMGGRDNMGEAARVLEEMHATGVPPNDFTLRTLLWGFGEARMPRAAERLLLEAESRFGVRPDSRCWEQVASAWQASGLPAEAQRLRQVRQRQQQGGGASGASQLQRRGAAGVSHGQGGRSPGAYHTSPGTTRPPRSAPAPVQGLVRGAGTGQALNGGVSFRPLGGSAGLFQSGTESRESGRGLDPRPEKKSAKAGESERWADSRWQRVLVPGADEPDLVGRSTGGEEEDEEAQGRRDDGVLVGSQVPNGRHSGALSSETETFWSQDESNGQLNARSEREGLQYGEGGAKQSGSRASPGRSASSSKGDGKADGTRQVNGAGHSNGSARGNINGSSRSTDEGSVVQGCSSSGNGSTKGNRNGSLNGSMQQSSNTSSNGSINGSSNSSSGSISNDSSNGSSKSSSASSNGSSNRSGRTSSNGTSNGAVTGTANGRSGRTGTSPTGTSTDSNIYRRQSSSVLLGAGLNGAPVINGSSKGASSHETGARAAKAASGAKGIRGAVNSQQSAPGVPLPSPLTSPVASHHCTAATAVFPGPPGSLRGTKAGLERNSASPHWALLGSSAVYGGNHFGLSRTQAPTLTHRLSCNQASAGPGLFRDLSQPQALSQVAVVTGASVMFHSSTRCGSSMVWQANAVRPSLRLAHVPLANAPLRINFSGEQGECRGIMLDPARHLARATMPTGLPCLL